MKIGATYKTPNKNQNKFFDGMEGEDGEITFICAACEQCISFDLWSYLGISGAWQTSFSPGEVSEIVRTLALPKVHEFYRSHEGGQPYISVQSCPNCSHDHLVYVGFYEFQPARYFGTLQGLYEAIT